MLGFQAVLGVKIANAVPCESEILSVIKLGEEAEIKYNTKMLSLYATMAEFYEVYFLKVDEFWPSVKKE